MADIKIYGKLVRSNSDTDGSINIVRGNQVEGGYFACSEAPTTGTWQTGQLCYSTNDLKFYQYDGAAWNEWVGAVTYELSKDGDTITLTRSDGIVSEATYDVVNYTANGLAPMLPNANATSKYLRGDGKWEIPPNDNTTYRFGTGDEQGQYKVNSTSYDVNGLGTSSSPTFATVNATTFNASSDKRLKENITPYICEKSILDLPVYEYNYIKNKNERYIGCLAQDLQEICPEIITEGYDGYLCIQESKIVYLLLDEVKKLKREVDELKQR